MVRRNIVALHNFIMSKTSYYFKSMEMLLKCFKLVFLDLDRKPSTKMFTSSFLKTCNWNFSYCCYCYSAKVSSIELISFLENVLCMTLVSYFYQIYLICFSRYITFRDWNAAKLPFIEEFQSSATHVSL